jgi:serine/threonine protein kinase
MYQHHHPPLPSPQVKLIDYGSLKFTDQMRQFVSPGGSYTSPTFTTATPDIGTMDFLEPSLLRGPGFARNHDPMDGRYDPAARDVWTLAEVLFFLVAGSELSRRLGPHKYSFFFIALASVSSNWPSDWKVLKTQVGPLPGCEGTVNTKIIDVLEARPTLLLTAHRAHVPRGVGFRRFHRPCFIVSAVR